MLKKIFCILGVFLLCIVSSCSAPKGECELLKEPKEIKKLSYKDFEDVGYQAFLSKVRIFSAKLTESYHKSYREELNTAISPLSLYMALSLTMECANNDTRQEILDALDLTYEDVLSYTKMLFSQSTREYKTENTITSKEVLTNSIWFQEGLDLVENTIDNLADQYYCYSYKTDFLNKNKQANQAIKEFIKRQTNGLIDSDFNMSTDTLIALINTLYLKDIWNNDGDDLKLTKDKYAFKNSNDKTKNMKLLQSYYALGKVYEEETFRHFYAKTNYGFKIKFIVPKDGYTLQQILTTENINKINKIAYDYKDEEKMEMYYTRCLFPEFKASCDKELGSFLKEQFHINLLFDKYNADLTNIADLRKYDDNLYCSAIIHKTKVEVNRKGIEGAAVTVVQLDAAGAPEPIYKNVYNDFIIDKSFGYLITDAEDTILFSGVIQDL